MQVAIYYHIEPATAELNIREALRRYKKIMDCMYTMIFFLVLYKNMKSIPLFILLASNVEANFLECLSVSEDYESGKCCEEEAGSFLSKHFDHSVPRIPKLQAKINSALNYEVRSLGPISKRGDTSKIERTLEVGTKLWMYNSANRWMMPVPMEIIEGNQLRFYNTWMVDCRTTGYYVKQSGVTDQCLETGIYENGNYSKEIGKTADFSTFQHQTGSYFPGSNGTLGGYYFTKEQISAMDCMMMSCNGASGYPMFVQFHTDGSGVFWGGYYYSHYFIADENWRITDETRTDRQGADNFREDGSLKPCKTFWLIDNFGTYYTTEVKDVDGVSQIQYLKRRRFFSDRWGVNLARNLLECDLPGSDYEGSGCGSSSYSRNVYTVNNNGSFQIFDKIHGVYVEQPGYYNTADIRAGRVWTNYKTGVGLYSMPLNNMFDETSQYIIADSGCFDYD